MTPITFLRQTVTNPNTGEESERLACKFDNAHVIKIWLRDESLDDAIARIKENKQTALNKIIVKDGEFGEFCVFTQAVTTEEI